MKLSDACELDVSEARYIFETTILEDGEGPRWKFNYDNWHNDPKPDILLLGAYKHPSTRNNLVGGINLHYINQDQRDRLARSLPTIMKSNNLKRRYWIGRQLVPDVFTNYYRTYNSRFIRGVTKDVMYPKYGYVKTAQNWLKKKLTSIFKTRKQREIDAQPRYPDDLDSMQDKLDQAVSDLVANPSKQPEDSPEMQAATRAFQDFKRQSTLRQLERQEDEPMQQAQQELDQAIQTPGVQNAERFAVQEPPTPPLDANLGADNTEMQRQASKRQLDALTKNNQQRNSRLKSADPNADLAPPTDDQSEIPVSPDPEPADELEEPADDTDIDPLGLDELDPPTQPDIDESIYYYSPQSKRYVLEHIQLF